MMSSKYNELLVGSACDFFDKHAVFVELASKVSNHSFFLTGGSGLFGSWIQAFLEWTIKRKYAAPTVTILSRKQRESALPEVNFVRGDITNFDFGNLSYHYALHMAAPSATETFQGIDELKKFETLCKGTERVLNFSRLNIEKRIVALSSGAIYGGFAASRKKVISELERNAPAYWMDSQALSVGKRVSEFLVKEYCTRDYIDASVARCFSFVGPGLPTNAHYAVGNFAKNALDGRDIMINGDGKPVRSYMHLGDMVYWIISILLYGKKGQDYNVGSQKPITMFDLAVLVREIFQAPSNIIVLGKPNTTAGNPPNNFYVPDTKKAQLELGLNMNADLKTAICDYAAFLKKI